jgi:hypothetical protein
MKPVSIAARQIAFFITGIVTKAGFVAGSPGRKIVAGVSGPEAHFKIGKARRFFQGVPY